jgi:hypothetical protein
LIANQHAIHPKWRPIWGIKNMARLILC